MCLKLTYTFPECKQLLKSKNIYCARYFASHYEILKVKRESSTKEIRESFLKLSKQYHPDINKDKKSHEQFLKIKEAYNVLSKANSRKLYDLGLSHDTYVEVTTRGHRGPAKVVYSDQGGKNPYDDPSFYRNRDKSQDQFYENQPYYGINGINKKSNLTVACVCLLVAFAGFILQVAAIRFSFTLKRDRLIEQSNAANKVWTKSREEAVKNGTQAQLDTFRRHFEEMNKNDKPCIFVLFI